MRLLAWRCYLLPFAIRCSVSRGAWQGAWVSARRRAQINLLYCFPDKSDAEREAIIDDMYTTAPQAMAMMAELALKGPEKIVERVDWKGLEIIDEMRRNDEKVIFLVPHGWGSTFRRC
ncbi:LpxL/LpxP family acyltransferase [Enterobacter hormaechei]